MVSAKPNKGFTIWIFRDTNMQWIAPHFEALDSWEPSNWPSHISVKSLTTFSGVKRIQAHRLRACSDPEPNRPASANAAWGSFGWETPALHPANSYDISSLRHNYVSEYNRVIWLAQELCYHERSVKWPVMCVKKSFSIKIMFRD